MKRLLTIFLVLALLCSLFGCAKQQQEDAPKRMSNATAVFVDQAYALSQTLAMSAEHGYLGALDTPAEVVSIAGIFAEAVNKEPDVIKLITTDEQNFAAQVIQLCSQFNGATEVACCSILTVNTLLHMENPPAKTTVVYLRYSEKCHMVAIFIPRGTHTVSATVYPMFFETAEALLQTHMSDAQDITQEEMQQAFKKAASISTVAQYSGSTPSKLYYFKVASRALTGTDPIDPAKIRELTGDEEVAKLAEQFAQAIVAEPTDLTIFHFPSKVNKQALDILSQAQYAEALEDLTFRKVHLSWLNEISLQYGTQCLVANAIVSSLASTRAIGTVASDTVKPALVALKLSDQFTLVMSIYPGEHNLYDYRYICIPVSYEEACSMLRSQGAERFM